MSDNLSGGTTASFNNTVQAKDDSYAFEENAGVTILDVMANDLGGTAKTLWSIDDSAADGSADLVSKDVVGASEYSERGARIYLINGKIAYDTSIFNSLEAGRTVTDHFTYAIRLANGTLSWATVTITITGTNDGPVAVADLAAGGENETLLVDVLGNDTDVDDGHVFTLLGASAPEGKGTASVVDGKVQFVPGTAFDHLAQGATETVTVSYTMRDEHGAQSTSTVTITITGTNDIVVSIPPAVFNGAGDPNDFDALTGTGPSNNAATISGDNSLGDNITGGSADQNIDGRGGNDTIYGQGGADTISGSNGDDIIYGQSGDDTLSGNNGVDRLFGGSGNDQLTGGNENDTLHGGSGNDVIVASGGNDILIGGYGADLLSGDGGSDTFRYLDLRDTGDTILDFRVGGADILDLAALDANGSVSGDQAFVWGGTTVTANGLWWAQSGANTVLYADTDGDTTTVEFSITLGNFTGFDPQSSAPPGDILL